MSHEIAGDFGQSIAAPQFPGVKRAAFSATIGNMLEFYDFIVYTFFAIQIGHSFFPVQSEYGSLMLSLGTFGAGFVTRPFGGILLGIYSDRVGRRPAMLVSLTLIGIGILAIALTPSYGSIGLAAPIIVIVARMLQGFALGGEFGASTAYLLEIAPPEHRTLAVSLQYASQQMAAAIGALIGFILSAALTPGDLTTYGWRIAFLIGASALPFGFWMRRTLPETVPQAPDGAVRPRWWVHFTLARKYGRPIVLAMMILANGTIAVYVTKYITTYAQTALHVAPSLAFAASVVGSVLQIVGAFLGGWLADRIRRKPVMIGAQLVTLALTYPTFLWIVDAPSAWSLLFGFGLFSLILTVPLIVFFANFAEVLPQQIRGGLFGTIYAVSIAIFGGTAQLVVTWLIHVLGDPLAPAWYLLAASFVGLAAMILMTDSTRATTAA